MSDSSPHHRLYPPRINVELMLTDGTLFNVADSVAEIDGMRLIVVQGGSERVHVRMSREQMLQVGAFLTQAVQLRKCSGGI